MAGKKISLITALGVLLSASALAFGVMQSVETEAASYLTSTVKANPHTYVKKKIEGYSTEFIRVDNSPNSPYKVIVAPSKPDGQFLGDIMNDYQAVSGMNGAYFSPTAYGNERNETHSDRIHNGSEFSKWPTDTGDRVIFGFDKEGNTVLHQTGKIGTDKKGQIQEGIGNFPMLLIGGKDVVKDRNHLITDKMKSKKDKTFLCSDSNQGVYFGVVKSISITDMPKVMKTMGCTDAINMDAGASTALTYDLKSKIKSWSPTMDGILVIKKAGLTDKEKKSLSKLASEKSDSTKYGIYSGYQQVKKLFK